MGRPTKKNSLSKKNAGGKNKREVSKNTSKTNEPIKAKNRRKSTDVSHKKSHDKKVVKSREPSLEKKAPRHKSISKEESKKKHDLKAERKKSIHKKEEKKNHKANNGILYLLCMCCGGNDDEELNEMLLQEEKRLEEAKKRKAEEAKKQLEEEEKKKKEEEAKKRKEEEEKKRKEKEEEKREEDVEPTKATVLKKIDVKAKPLQKKAQIVFTSSAAAPPPPPAKECEGPPPKVKETSVSLAQGAYLIYKDENGGQLEINYSKEAIRGNGVLAYIAANSIPNFYFNKNNGKDVLIKNISRLMQSEYVSDRILYYEKWNEFLKLRKTLNGVLYLLPAFNSSPPAKIDILFLNSQQKKIQFAPVDKPVEMSGDYLFIIQHGLEVFRKEVNVDALVSYVNSFGVVAHL